MYDWAIGLPKHVLGYVIFHEKDSNEMTILTGSNDDGVLVEDIYQTAGSFGIPRLVMIEALENLRDDTYGLVVDVDLFKESRNL